MNDDLDTLKKGDAENSESDGTKGHLLDIGPGCLAIDLPAGWIDGETIHTTAVVKEMTGHEEEYLASKGPILPRLNAIIGGCLVRLGSEGDKKTIVHAVSGLTAQDRMAILLAVRRISLGDFYDCDVTCPNCKVAQHKTLNLKDIEIIPMKDRAKRDRVDVLPSGTEVKWHVVRASDEEWLGTQKKKKNDKLTLGLLARVEAVGDAELDRSKKYRQAIAALKDLSVRDRSFLRGLFDTEEGSVDTTVQFDCEDCGHEWEGEMDISQSNFFFPRVK